jgi:hypothetical protein
LIGQEAGEVVGEGGVEVECALAVELEDDRGHHRLDTILAPSGPGG